VSERQDIRFYLRVKSRKSSRAYFCDNLSAVCIILMIRLWGLLGNPPLEHPILSTPGFSTSTSPRVGEPHFFRILPLKANIRRMSSIYRVIGPASCAPSHRVLAASVHFKLQNKRTDRFWWRGPHDQEQTSRSCRSRSPPRIYMSTGSMIGSQIAL
jgi:hypothetical protein